MSAGPATPLGRLKVSANGVAHGLRSERVVLAHEDPAAYTEHVQTWVDALLPADEAELEVVVSIADCRWRLKRIAAIEVNRQRAEVLAQVEDTPEQKFLHMVENTATATAYMADTVDQPLQLDTARLQALLSAVRRVSDMVLAVEQEQVGVRLGATALADAISMLVILSNKGDAEPQSLDDLRKAARLTANATAALLPQAREAAEKVRQQLAATVPLPDGKQQALLTRYTKDIERRLAAEMAFLQAVRERKVHAKASSGSLGQPLPVMIRLVG